MKQWKIETDEGHFLRLTGLISEFGCSNLLPLCFFKLDEEAEARFDTEGY